MVKKIDYKTGLGDMAGLMVTTEQSLRHLNTGLLKQGSVPVDNRQFRGNLSVDCLNKAPWQEDGWREIFIKSRNGKNRENRENAENIRNAENNENTKNGKNYQNYIMKNFLKCTRCSVTTLDPTTGIRRPDGEPYKWLEKFGRMCTGPELNFYDSPHYGMYYAPLTNNKVNQVEVEIGDEVYAKF